MKKTIIALTALIAATVGFQSQAQAGQKVNIGFEVQLGNGFSVHKIHQSNKYSHKHNKRHKRKGRRYGNKKHFHGHNYYHRCRIAGKRSIRRSLRRHGFYDIHQVRRYGRMYSAKAVSPRGHLVKVKINGCNRHIIKRRIIRSYPTVWSQGNSWRTYW